MKVSPVRDRRTANPVALAQLSTRQYFLAPDLLACVARLREGIGTQLGLIEVRQLPLKPQRSQLAGLHVRAEWPPFQRRARQNIPRTLVTLAAGRAVRSRSC